MARITIYRRHTEECCAKHGWVHSEECKAENAGKKQKHCACPVSDKEYKRCDCPIWFYQSKDGKKLRWASGERDWKEAEKLASQLDSGAAEPADRANGRKTLAEAITDFLNNKKTKVTKRGTEVCDDTLYRHATTLGVSWDQTTETWKPTGNGLLGFCTDRNITLLKDVKLIDIERWQATWTLDAAGAKRSRQEKVRNFFRYCINHDFITKNPLNNWELVPLNRNDLAVSEDRIIRPKVYDRIMRAIDEMAATKNANGHPLLTVENRLRLKTCMRLQRESGLAIVDAVTLHKCELIKEAGRYRIRTNRQKTNTNVNNIITDDLGQTLLTVKNGNPEYFFWSGKTLPEDAPSYFQKLYRRIFKFAKVNHTSHDFRHTYAATFLEAGGDIRLLSKALGHSSVQVTEAYYGHFTKKQQTMLDQQAERALALMVSGD